MNKKLHLAMFAVTGLLPAAVAQADVREAKVSRVLASSATDLAPVTGTTPPRLRRTDEEQPGNEMAHLAFFDDGKTGLYFSMNTDLNGVLANHRVQLALVPFHLAQAADGSVSAVADMTGAKFVTDNNGNEYRNANHPVAYATFGGANICAEYNYQPNGTNDTKRYMQCFDKTGAVVMPQTLIYAKNNDDCSMNQDKTSTWVTKVDSATTKIVAWRGCNGNGTDDGWLQAATLTKDTAGKITFAQTVDVSLCPREERSHGFCSTSTADPNTAYCSWTEGNTQPQRDGTWLAAVDISGTLTGQAAIVWKQQIDGRKDANGVRTYSMRAMTDRIMAVNPTTGALEATDMIFWRSGDVRGNNNTNGKGGAYMGNQMAVMQLSRGPDNPIKYIMPMTNMQKNLLGLDGTHLGMTSALLGTTDKLMPGLMFLGGSQLGGGYSAQLRTVGYDKTTNAFKDLGMTAIAPYDRHLYPNYLGNNPGNQGRNYSGMEFIKNPFVGMNGNTDAYLAVIATTGKDPTEAMMPERKLSAYITVVPVAQTASTGGSGTGSGSGSGSDQGTGDPGTTDNQPGQTLGGCSTTGSTGGLAFLLVGLAGLIRRRSRK